MSRLKNIIVILGSLLLLLSVFVYDVAERAVTIDIGGAAYIREAAVLAAFLLLYLYVRGSRIGKAVAIPKNIGKLLAYSLVVLFLTATIYFVTQSSANGEEASVGPRGAVGNLLSLLLAVSLGLFSITTLLTIKDLILRKRKKGTKRNFVIYLVLMICTNLSVLPLIPAEGNLVASILFPLALVLIVINSFKQNWIVYLSRREKIYSIVYGALLFVSFVGLNVFSKQTLIDRSLGMFNQPLQSFIQLNAMFGAVYFGMAFVTTLFHLPTADVFERKQSELTSLHNLSRLVTQVFDFNDLLNTVTNMTLEVVGAKSAWLELLKAPASNGEVRIDVVSLKNISPEQINAITVDSESSLRRLVMESKRALLIDDVSTDRRTRYIKKRGVDIGSLLSVPLVSHGELIGFLHATKDFQFGFDQDDIDVMTTFADHVTIAIENSKLIQKSLVRERYQQEMMVAQEMQRRLLPQRLPEHPFLQIAAVSEPSMEVGGDYFDFVKLDGDRFGVVVGDVSGKGVSAAFYMAEVKGIFQSLSKLCTSPRDLLVRANQALKDSLEKKAFISLLYGIIDLGQGKLTLARAGHCPLVYISGLAVELVRPTGIGLGLTNDALFEEVTQETTIDLKKDDVCIFYTDGINESRNGAGEEFGFDRLVQAALGARYLPAEQMKQIILAEIRNHTGDSSYGDDMTLVVIKWVGQSEVQ
ncbi:MAG TPA: hypothetical protein DCP63_02570 [Bacteroidetes bacterium]|nr:hypothetical protein [Bacteroidota bacterium]